MTIEIPYMLLAGLGILGLVIVVILAPVFLVTLIAYIEYQRLECSIRWVEEMRRITHPSGSCCCGTCLDDIVENEEI